MCAESAMRMTRWTPPEGVLESNLALGNEQNEVQALEDVSGDDEMLSLEVTFLERDA